MTSTDTYQLKWHSHGAHLHGSLGALLRSERFTDVVLCTLDGSQLPAHKFVLSSCSAYLAQLLEGQRSAGRAGALLYVVLPPDVSARALKILVEYMYKGETTVSNDVLDTVLKAGEVLKIRGLWRQTEENSTTDLNAAEKTSTTPTINLNLQNKPDDMAISRLSVKKDDKLLKTFPPMQPQNRPMFIGPPKLVFIKTTEANTGLRPLAPKGQTIIVTPDINKIPTPEPVEKQDITTSTIEKLEAASTSTTPQPPSSTPPRVLKKPERKYGKRAKVDKSNETDGKPDEEGSKKKGKLDKADDSIPMVTVKDEPEWDDSSIEEEERTIAEMFHTEMNIKAELDEDADVDEDSLIYSPLTCELCAEVFTVPAAWVRHIEGHANSTTQHTRKRKIRSASDDTEETMALLRCDLCQKHFPNPAEWVRHIQSTHTEVEGVQNKTCSHCKKLFPSHASMLIHMRTHTGERPFVCGLCNKGFNVKSNLLRHLRTLHDHIISPGQVDEEGNSTDEAPSTSSSDRPAVKPES